MRYAKIALRNLSRQKRRTILLGGAIGFGIMVITLINGFTAGAATNLKENFSYLLAGHVYVSEQTRRDDETVVSEFRDHAALQEALAEIGLDGGETVRRSDVHGRLLFSGRTAEQVISGVDWEAELELRRRLVLREGDIGTVTADPRALVLSEAAARRLGVAVGEEVLVRANTVTGQLNVGTLTVRGIMQDPGILGSVSSYAHREAVNEIINIAPESYQAAHIMLPAIESVDAVTRDLHAALASRATVADRTPRESMDLSSMSFVYQSGTSEPWSGSRFVVSNINDYAGEIDQLAVTLNWVGTGVLLVLVIITMVGVINTFRMIMYERVREIGTMRAIGVQRRGIRRIFLWEAFLLATLGYVAGIIAAAIGAALIGLIAVPLDSPFALFTVGGTLTFPVAIGVLVLNYVMITLLTVGAAAIPARAAARLQPADALRSVA